MESGDILKGSGLEAERSISEAILKASAGLEAQRSISSRRSPLSLRGGVGGGAFLAIFPLNSCVIRCVYTPFPAIHILLSISIAILKI